MTWMQPDFKGGISPKIHQEIQEGKRRYDYPEPELKGNEGDLICWVKGLDTEQLVQAYYDIHERWTWESGEESERVLLDYVQQEIEDRGDPHG